MASPPPPPPPRPSSSSSPSPRPSSSSSSSSASSSPSEPLAIEQVITEFFAKSLHIILESRSPYVSSRNYTIGRFNPSSPSSSSSPCSPSSSMPRDKWFNLALRECPAALENFDLWRQSNLEPLVIDIVLIRRASRSSPGTEGRCANWSEEPKIVERWIVQYAARKSISSGIPNLYRKTYSSSIVLLRSLYLFVRLLPAYKLFRELNSSGRIRPLGLSHRISSFVGPSAPADDAEMKHFGFVPIDTPCGRLSLSVSYLPNLETAGGSGEPSTPFSPQFIVDYVGSPNTDPLKRFQSLPPAMGRHSWSDDHGNLLSLSPSPSPTYSDSQALHGNQKLRLPPRIHDNSMSPQFSMSTSPSTPAQLSGGSLPTALMRCESAPVSIPADRVGALPPSPSLKSTNLRAEKKIQIKKELLKMGELHADTALQKVILEYVW